MWQARCIQVVTPLPARVALLKQEYSHYLRDAAGLGRQLDRLVPLHGHAAIDRWKALAHAGDWDGLVEELLVRHYDPTYRRSIGSHYPLLRQARTLEIESADPAAFVDAARRLLSVAAESVT
jgi:tRNA 2-selenouridine synthase